MVTRGARYVKLSFRLGKTTGEAMFGGDGVNCKTLAPAGQVSSGPLDELDFTTIDLVLRNHQRVSALCLPRPLSSFIQK